MKMIYRIDESKFESELEKELANELNVPYVRCSYCGDCSHLFSTDELEFRYTNGFLNKGEYVINYEMYNTKEEYDNMYCGGFDGEVHELIYTIDEDNCFHVISF